MERPSPHPGSCARNDGCGSSAAVAGPQAEGLGEPGQGAASGGGSTQKSPRGPAGSRDKTALQLVRDNQAVYAEDLAVCGLARTRLARSVHDAGWGQLLALIEEKAAQHGREFRRIGRFVPTSQVCSACGISDGPKPLSVRTWQCVACGAQHDRDVNAARNILAAGRADRLNACGGSVRPPVVVAARVKQEPTEVPRERHGRKPVHDGEDVNPRVLDELAAMNPGVLVPAHCTGWRAQHAMSARFPDAFVPNAVGTSFHL